MNTTTVCDLTLTATLGYVAMTWPIIILVLNMTIIFLQFWLKQNKIDINDISGLLDQFAKKNNFKLVNEIPQNVNIEIKDEKKVNVDELKKFSLI